MGVVEDNGVVAMGTREATLVDKVLAFIGINSNNDHHINFYLFK